MPGNLHAGPRHNPTGRDGRPADLHGHVLAAIQADRSAPAAVRRWAAALAAGDPKPTPLVSARRESGRGRRARATRTTTAKGS